MTTEHEPKRIIPGICVRPEHGDDNKITDDPPFNNGYVADKASIATSGEVTPAVERCLCKAHYLLEHAEVHNGRNPFAAQAIIAEAEARAAEIVAEGRAKAKAAG